MIKFKNELNLIVIVVMRFSRDQTRLLKNLSRLAMRCNILFKEFKYKLTIINPITILFQLLLIFLENVGS